MYLYSMETFEEKFRNRYQLSEADASALLSHMEEVRFKKKEVIVQEGKFHQVKRMVKAVGSEVLYLKRLSMGSLKLDEELKLGEYRRLTKAELQELKEHRR